MVAEPSQTVGDLRRKAVVTDDEIAAATDAYLADPKCGPFHCSSGHILSIAQALSAFPPSHLICVDVHARPADKRRAVHTAVLRALK